MPSLFTKIVNGEIPAYKVAETDEFLAFLDIFPLAKGHVLCIPKIETDYIFDLDDDVLSRLMIFSKSVAKKMDKVLDCKRIGVAVIGLEVPHAHVHLVPLQTVEDINFSREKLKFSPDEMEEVRDLIAKA